MRTFATLTPDEKYMQRCLELAKKGMGSVSPNPMVGAVLVYQDRIIGEGYHEQFGESHAEVNCIHNVSEGNKHFIAKSTLYVSLEPCNHHGKTPPCTDFIIKHKIPKVVIACTDIFKEVNGTGIQKLKRAGVDVITGVLEVSAQDLNRRFFVFHKKQRPYVILKWAQSSNKKINALESTSTKISNQITDRLVHQWRSEEAAILVGKNTALIDNPQLTNRLCNQGKQPLRIFIDKDLQVPTHFNLLNQTVPTLIINQKLNKKENNNEYVIFDFTQSILVQLNKYLFDRGVTSLIVEGGAYLLNSFIREGYWDEARVITNTLLMIQEGVGSPILENEFIQKRQSVLSDTIEYFRNAND